MHAPLKAVPLILLGVFLNAFAQIPLKKGVQAVGGLELAPVALLRLFLQPWILLGLACYGVSVVVWLGVLSKTDVNFAYPFLALGFLANALLARWILGEAIPAMRWAALTLIVLGVALQALSGRSTPGTVDSGIHGQGTKER